MENKRDIRLLIVDPEASIRGGVDTVRRLLIPELGKRCSEVRWMMEQHRIPDFTEVEGVCFATFAPPAWTLIRWWHALLRRMPGDMFSGIKFRAGNDCMDAAIHWWIRRSRCDLVLVPCIFTLPPPDTSTRVVGIVYDLTPETNRNETMRLVVANWLDRADGVLATSTETLAGLSLLGTEVRAPVKLLSLGASRRNWKARPPLAEPPLFLYPATLSGHKGHRILLEAALELTRRKRLFQLVLTGAGTELLDGDVAMDGTPEEARLFFYRHRAELQKCVCVRGKIEAGELTELYATAWSVVLPSTFEGFGLPFSEALSAGCPLIASDIAPFREQGEIFEPGASVRFVPAAEPLAWADAMEEALENRPPVPPDPSLRRSWGDVAEELLDWGAVLERRTDKPVCRAEEILNP